ncbi:hypothetical protein GCM10023228_07370 [Brevibacillus fulvus]
MIIDHFFIFVKYIEVIFFIDNAYRLFPVESLGANVHNDFRADQSGGKRRIFFLSIRNPLFP